MQEEDNANASPIPSKLTIDAQQPSKHVYSDTERQIFNVSLSVHQFQKEARRDESKTAKARKSCRELLESGRILEARNAAREALIARGRAYAYSAVSKRIDWLLRKLNDDGVKPEIEEALKDLDSAVMANDIWQAKHITGTILTEIEKVDAPDLPETPTEREITQYLKQLKEEIAIMNRLKVENGSSLQMSTDLSTLMYYQDKDVDSDVSSIISSASRIRSVGEKRIRKKFRVKERSIFE